MSAIDRINRKRKELEAQEQVKAGKITSSEASMQRIESLTNELRQNNNKIDYADMSQVIHTSSSIKSKGSVSTDSNGNVTITGTVGNGSSKKEEKPWYKQFFKGSEAFNNVGSAFNDGYDFGDVTKTLLKGSVATVKTAGATAADVGLNLIEGVARVGEGVGKLGAGVGAQVLDWTGNDEYAQLVRDRIAGKEKTAFGTTGAPVSYWLNKGQEKVDSNSISGKTGDEIASLVGYTGGLVYGGQLLGSIGGTATAGTATTGVTANLGNVGINIAGKTLNIPTLAFVGGASSGLEEAYSKDNVTDAQAWSKALGSGAIEGVTEGLFGMFGVGGSSLDDFVSDAAIKGLKTGIGKTLASTGIKASGEAVEEFLSYAGNQGLDWLIDKASKESSPDFYSKWDWEEVGEQMGMAFISSGIAQGGSTIVNANTQANIAIKNAEQELGRKLTAKEKISVRDQVLNSVVSEDIAPARDEISNTTTQEEQTNSLVDVPSNTLNTVNNKENDKITKSIEELQEDLKTVKGSQARSEVATQISALQEGYTSVSEYKAALENERQDSLIAPIKQTINNSQDNTQVVDNTKVNNTLEEQEIKTPQIKNENFSKQVDSYVNKTMASNEMFDLGKTPDVIKDLGIPDLEITMKQKTLKHIIENGELDSHQHSIDPEIIKKIPEAIANPLNVLYSNNSSKGDSIVVVTDLSDNADRQIIASILIDSEGQIGNIDFLSNEVTSAYGKNNYDEYMKKEIAKGNLLYDIDDGKIKELALARVKSSESPSSANNIVQNSENVNNSIPTREELDSLEDIRQNQSGSEYAAAFYDLEKKYGKANLYKGINEYNSNAKNANEEIAPVRSETTPDVQEDIAPIKEAVDELKTVKKEVTEKINELKKNMEEIKTNIQEEISPLKEALEEIDIPGLENLAKQNLDNIKEEDIPVRNNLTEEEQKRLEELEVYDNAFGLNTEEELELNQLREKEAGRNYMPDSEYSPLSSEYEMPETITPKVAQEKMKSYLGINEKQAADLYNKIATDENFDKDKLDTYIRNNFKENNFEEYESQEVREVRNYIRNTRLDMSSLKSQFPSSKDYNNFRKSHFGALRLANSGQAVDSFYQELSEEYPQYFSSDNVTPLDQIQAIADFMDYNQTIQREEGAPIPEEIIEEYTNTIYDDVINAEATKALDEELNNYVDRLTTEEIIAPYKGQEQAAAENVEETKYKTRNQMQRRLDTVDKQITRLTDLANRMNESMNKYNKRLADAQEQIALDRVRNGSTPFDEYLNEQVIQGIYEQAAPVTEKYDKYATKLQELVEEKNKLTEEIANTPEKKSKKQIQRELVDKTGIIEEGLDNANRMSKFMLNNTDPIRVQEIMFGQEIGSKINEEYFQRVKDNTSDKIRFQNEERAKIEELGIKARSKESAAVQKYGEKQVVNDKTGEVITYGDKELAAEFPNAKTQEKIKNAAKVMRGMYDNYIDEANKVLTGLGYDVIPKRADYFRHFNELSDKFSQWGIPLNLNDMKANDLPTDINGLTADFTPGKNFFASALQRTGNKTTYDAITGIDGYLEGIGNLIYHTEDIQRLRGLENYVRETYGQQHGFENFDQLTEDQKAKRIKAIQDNRLSNYAAWLHEYTNQLAGKKAMVDRSFEDTFGRRIYSLLDTANKQVGANMIGFNISSAMTNAIAGVQAIAKTNKVAAVKGLADTVKNIFVNDGFVEKNGFLTSRFGSERISKTAWQKIADTGYMFMSGTDNFISNFVVRSKYNELKAKGLSETEAHVEAGKFASKLMADRSQGGQATLYNSKVLGVLTKFQYEVNNQLYSMFYDTFQESKAKSNGNVVKMTASMASTLGQLAVFTHIFGSAFEKVAGYNPTFDIIGIIAKALGFDDDEDSEDTLKDNLGQAFNDLLKALPYSSIFTGGRIPIGEALPIKELITGKDSYGNDTSRLNTLKETAPYWLMPSGYGQLKKTTGGLGLFDDSLPVAGSYTDSGNLRFTVEDTTENRIKSAIFGKWSNEEAQKYIDSEFKTIKASSVEELADLGMKSSEYRKLKENITKAGKTNKEKVDYITSLDNLSDKQKNILINNILDRDYTVDASDYEDFGSYEEFDYSYKNPEKYNWLKENNISYDDYVSSDDTKEMYDYAYKNPDKYELGKAATNNFSDYYTYKQDINDMSADKDSSGKSISGSRKTKVISYVNGLDLSIPQKAMIIRTEYSSFDDYNNEIVSYVDGLDISYDKKVSILESLDMKVLEDGSVRWE